MSAMIADSFRDAADKKYQSLQTLSEKPHICSANFLYSCFDFYCLADEVGVCAHKSICTTPALLASEDGLSREVQILGLAFSRYCFSAA